MARPLRVQFPDAVYHVTSRGNARQKIFFDDHDNRRFLELFGKTAERFNWICHAFCLMVNHYHLMIETPEANLSRGMHHLNASFCQAHHRRYGTGGHFLQGRFKAIVVDRDSYLLELARYVVLNPIRAGLVDRPEAWRWSSYRVTAGLPSSEKWPFLQTGSLLGHFGPDEKAACRRYVEFVSLGIGQDSPWTELKSQLFLGPEAFIERLHDAIPGKHDYDEIPKLQRYAARPPLEEIFGQWKSKKRRNEAIVKSHIIYGYEQKAIADFLGIHYTTVSHAIRKSRQQTPGVRS